MNKLKFIHSFIILFVLVSFYSCSSKHPQDAFLERNFSEDFDDVSKEVCEIVNGKSLLITDILEYNTLKPTAEGKFLAEHLRASLLNNCKVKLYQIELRKHIKLSGTGSTALTRNIKKIKKKNFKAKYLLTGTYSKTYSTVVVFIKLLNVQAGKLIKEKVVKVNYYSKSIFSDDPFDL